MDKRTVLAFVLCGVIALIWFWYMHVEQQKRAEEAHRKQAAAQREKEELAEGEAEPAEPGRKPDEAATEEPEEKPAQPEPERPQVPEEPAKDDITVSRKGIRHQTVWTNRGGALIEARLVPTQDRRYRQSVDSEEGVALVKGLVHGPRTFLLKDSDTRTPFHLDTANYNYNPDYLQSDRPLIFDYTFGRRLRVTKTFTFKPEKYAIDVTIELKNVDPTRRTIKNMSYQLLAAARLLPESPGDRDLAGLVGYKAGREKWKFDTKAPAAAAKEPWTRKSPPGAGEVTWAGAANRYFAGALIARDSDSIRATDLIRSASIHFLSTSDIIAGEEADGKETPELPPGRQSPEGTSGEARPTSPPAFDRQLDPVLHDDNVTVMIQTKPEDIPYDKTLTHKYTYFLGPKKAEFLEEYPAIEGVLDYGWFGFISRILLSLLNGLYAVSRNYGVGIVFLTIVVKIILHPLTRKGQISMHKMQKLQPLIREIQEKYKDDRQRLGREQMDLFRKHGANPMSGCWPLLMQIPVFFGLFNMLRYSVDLRHEGFLWVSDLSRPDTVGAIAGYPLNILPILMVVSWVIQQATQPKPADPKQASQRKMMMFLPIVFGIMLYGSPSGLILYWFTSTFLGIFEQRFIKYQIQKMEERGGFPAVASPAAASKSTRPKGRRR